MMMMGRGNDDDSPTRWSSSPVDSGARRGGIAKRCAGSRLELLMTICPSDRLPIGVSA